MFVIDEVAPVLHAGAVQAYHEVHGGCATKLGGVKHVRCSPPFGPRPISYWLIVADTLAAPPVREVSTDFCAYCACVDGNSVMWRKGGKHAVHFQTCMNCTGRDSTYSTVFYTEIVSSGTMNTTEKCVCPSR